MYGSVGIIAFSFIPNPSPFMNIFVSLQAFTEFLLSEAWMRDFKYSYTTAQNANKSLFTVKFRNWKGAL